MNQLDLILDQLGTPLIEEVYKPGRFNKREQVFKNGKINPKEFKELFTSEPISSDCIDFILKCLQFDPKKRITVEEALEHTIFDKYRDKSEETTTEKISRFDFIFEDEEIDDISHLRLLILEEIMLYHDYNWYMKYQLDKKNYNDFVFETTKLISNSSFFLKSPNKLSNH